MDHLRQSVNLRGYAHKNPVQEFKRESFTMFTSLLDTIDTEMVKALCSVNVDQKRESAEVNVNERQPPKTSVKQAQNITKPKPAQLPKKAKKQAETTLALVAPGKNISAAMVEKALLLFENHLK